MLPLISRRWARLLRGPSHAWRDVALSSWHFLDSDDEDVPQRPAAPSVNAAAALAWFAGRPM